ncbi:uncharacterized protein LOC141587467 [Silene latifolia]|uniref:uncharacterized protein LOC141587467 n=1 Tax=Silene latifolia TaxID=37657 RepID=UPI003D786332
MTAVKATHQNRFSPLMTSSSSLKSAQKSQKSLNIHSISHERPKVVTEEDEDLQEGWLLRHGGKDIPVLPTIHEEEASEELLQFTHEDIKTEVEFWSHFVMCYILGANPPWKLVEDYIYNVWGRFRVERVSFLDNGVFLVRFTKNEDRDALLQSGYYLYDNKPIVIKPWTVDIELVKAKVDVVPVWVKLFNVPLKFWGSCLPTIAGLVGKFVKKDQDTHDKVRLSYARVMVELAMDQTLPAKVKFLDESGQLVFVPVEYEWKPISCTSCNGIGHNATQCKKPVKKLSKPKQKTKQVWKPVQIDKVQAAVVNPVSNSPILTPTSFPPLHTVRSVPIQSTPAKNIMRLNRQVGVRLSAKFIERLGGNTTDAEMQHFQDCVSICGMEDIPSTGALFTGSNKQNPADRVYSSLDRAMGNQAWLDGFGDNYAHFHPEGLFDHCPCTVLTTHSTLGGKKNFKYFNMWSSASQFKNIVGNVWSIHIQGTKMFSIIKKLKALKPALKSLNKCCFSDIENSTTIATVALENIQKLLVENPGDIVLLQQEMDMAHDLKELISARDSFLIQKAKVQWSLEGDLNTNYFHHAIKKRIYLNKVFQIEDMNGGPCTDGDSIQAAFLEYYKSLMGSQTETEKVNLTVVRQGACCIAEHWNILNKPVTVEEINATIITLIPKMERPETVKHYRPISCCNVIYKTISKLLCARLAVILPDIISRNQGAFVKGRNILENILICQDLVRLYNRGMASPRCMFKLDLQKAYDTIEWKFVDQMLSALKFPPKFHQLIMACLTTPTYTLNLNGAHFGYFPGKKGLRYHPLCKSLKLTHLLFADDLLMFCKGDSHSIMLLLRAMDTFSATSGLKVNAAKSEVVFNGVVVSLKADIIQVSGFQEGALPFKYLGVPLQPGRLLRRDCKVLTDKIVRKIRGIGARKLSYAGRLDNSTEYNRAPLVAWNDICHTKKKGELGIKNAGVWNVASVGKLVHWLYAKADRLWVLWIDHVYLKGADWSNYHPPPDSNWNWRNICKTRELLSSGYQGHHWQGQPTCTGYTSHEHLFTDCVYTSKVSTGVEDWLHLTLTGSAGYTKLQKKIRRLARMAVWLDHKVKKPEYVIAEIIAEIIAQVRQRIIHKIDSIEKLKNRDWAFETNLSPLLKGYKTRTTFILPLNP